jgi:hypothetical protein
MLSLSMGMISLKWLYKMKENLKISKERNFKNGWVSLKSYLPELVQLKSLLL